MTTLWQDLRYGARRLLKKPGFTLIVVITMALSIGTTTAISNSVSAAGHDGKKAIVCCWSDITPTLARWEQAFSPDGGKSWETNWIMEFTRV